ncbi:MAG TPA: hypothetical protein VNE82_16850 [Candidatus Binataceae bacterium]|nr:hypothetical protein [Candidatus Binataceae bacterium]
MAKRRPTDIRNKQTLKKYVPPAVVDYGTIAKITSAPKQISGPDSQGAKKGSCL